MRSKRSGKRDREPRREGRQTAVVLRAASLLDATSAKMFLAFFLWALLAASRAIVHPGPAYPATEGEIWPKPQSEKKLPSYFTVDPQLINITIAGGETCDVLEKAVSRYKHIISRMHRYVKGRHTVQRREATTYVINASMEYDEKSILFKSVPLGQLDRIDVMLSNPCEEYPHLDMVESYDLVISNQSSISSTTLWGILRGLESLSQLLYLSHDYSEVRINATSISDYPRYGHRGLLLDTSRHFISTGNILRILDAMTYNKLNVFHWHIVDDQSFPYVSTKYPNLSARGAYDQRAVYTPEEVTTIVKYARDRGIRVVPEFDVPGHTRSWGEAYPELLVECFTVTGEKVGLGPMDPTKNATFSYLKELFKEVSTVFQDQYLHIGGDEVEKDCWEFNPDIIAYMREHNMTSAKELQGLFMNNVLPTLPEQTKPIVWQDVLDDDVILPQGSLVQIWKSSYAWEITSVLASGYRVLYSTCWYLDHLKSGGDWRDFYHCDPREMVKSYDPGNRHVEDIIGGEACMWSEVVDDNNVLSRIWPRASATAEKLWSAPSSQSMEKVSRRLEEHTCRMRRRRIPAQPPSGPGYCLVL